MIRLEKKLHYMSRISEYLLSFTCVRVYFDRYYDQILYLIIIFIILNCIYYIKFTTGHFILYTELTELIHVFHNFSMHFQGKANCVYANIKHHTLIEMGKWHWMKPNRCCGYPSIRTHTHFSNSTDWFGCVLLYIYFISNQSKESFLWYFIMINFDNYGSLNRDVSNIQGGPKKKKYTEFFKDYNLLYTKWILWNWLTPLENKNTSFNDIIFYNLNQNWSHNRDHLTMN